MDRRLFLNQIGRAAATLGVGALAGPSFGAADESISSKHITFGSSTAMTGPLGPSGLDHMLGIRAAFATVNRTGGIHGRELRLIAKDDAYDPKRTAQNVKGMLDDGSVFSFISQIGTANTAAMIPLIEKAGAPLVGPITGASSLRKPEFQNVFHIRPGYSDEVTRMVQQLTAMGLTDIAFVYLDNAFGREVLADAQRVVAQAKLEIAGNFELAFDGKTAAETAEKVLQAKAGAVFLAATGTGVTDFLIALRARAAALPVVGMSVTYTDLPRLGKERATGLAMATVFPSRNAKKFVLVRNFDAAIAASNFTITTGGALESWINAQVLIEGVRRAGRDITRDKLRVALAGLRNMEIGELIINISPSAPYVGTLPVRLSVMGPDLKFRA